MNKIQCARVKRCVEVHNVFLGTKAHGPSYHRPKQSFCLTAWNISQKRIRFSDFSKEDSVAMVQKDEEIVRATVASDYETEVTQESMNILRLLGG